MIGDSRRTVAAESEGGRSAERRPAEPAPCPVRFFSGDLSVSGARFLVRNNQFLHDRARGALLQTVYGLVEGNTFAGQALYALYWTCLRRKVLAPRTS
jgi:hypothetical protein